MNNPNKESLSEVVNKCERDELVELLNGKVILNEVLIRTGIFAGTFAAVYGGVEIARYYHLADYFR